MHRYTIDIETGINWPFEVTVTRLGESKTFYGKTRKAVLKIAIAYIESEEEL